MSLNIPQSFRFLPRVPKGIFGVFLFNAAMVLFLLCATVPNPVRVLVSDLFQTTGALLAGALSLIAAGRDKVCSRRARWAAICLGSGTFCFGVGSGVWTYCENVLHHDNPFPSGADAFFLLTYPLLALGFFLVPRRTLSKAAQMMAALDSLMILTGLTTFAWYCVLGPAIQSGQGSAVAKVLGAIYPLLDLILLGCMVLLWARAGGAHRVMNLLGVGLVSIVVVDMAFAIGTLRGTYHTGGPIDALWPLGYMLLALAGHILRQWEHISPKQDVSESEKEIEAFYPPPLWRVLLPYLPVPTVAALILTTVHTHGDESLETGVYIGAALLITLVLARQCFAVLENRRLTARLAHFNTSLEATIAARTDALSALSARTVQMSALLALTAAVHEASDEQRIVAAARQHTLAALSADGVQVCLFPDGAASLSAVHEERISVLSAPIQDGAEILGTLTVLRQNDFDTFTDAALLRSVGAEVGRALGNTRRLQEARDTADRDPVTGLFNHRAIHQRLDHELLAANAADYPLSLIMMDLDNFKLFNDTYGHPVGDEVLRLVATALRSECGVDVQSARYGGDEFLLLLPGQDGTAARALARRLQARLAQETLQSEEMVSGDRRIIPVALSCGVAAFPADSVDRHELLSIADANLYSAKGSEDGVMESSDAQRANRTLRNEGGFGLLDAMLTAVDNKDRYTRRHSEDVTEYALWIAEEIDLSPDEKKALRQGGLLHDVGKIGVPEDILRKPARLTGEEYAILKRHAELGALIVGGVPGMSQVLDAVRHHHERWDGNGYPDGLAGEAIPLSGRILAIADAMSAMTTDRPYRRGMEWSAAMAIVREGRATQFDPELADAFLRAAARRAPSAAVILRAA